MLKGRLETTVISSGLRMTYHLAQFNRVEINRQRLVRQINGKVHATGDDLAHQVGQIRCDFVQVVIIALPRLAKNLY